MPEQKEPMIGKESRPSAIDYNAPVAGMNVGDIVRAVGAHISEQIKAFYNPEYYKPEFYKPEFWKEGIKPEVMKPPPESGISEQLVERVAVRVIETLKQRGAIK